MNIYDGEVRRKRNVACSGNMFDACSILEDVRAPSAHTVWLLFSLSLSAPEKQNWQHSVQLYDGMYVGTILKR